MFYGGAGDSAKLAQRLQEMLIQSLNPGSNRKAKPAKGVYLMEHITRPGILLECGFISNREEEAKLRDPDYQKKLCAVIAATVSSYLTAT